MSTEFVEKDSKIGYIITIIILVLAVLGMGSYIVYDKFIKEEDVSLENVEEVEKVYELSASHAANLMEKVEVYNSFLYKYYLMDDNEEMSNVTYYYFAYRVLMFEGKDITVENVSNVLDDYFGDDVELADIVCLVCGEVLYEYDSENNIYIEKDHPGHGGDKQAMSNVRYVSSKVEGNKVTLVTKILYERSCSDTCGPLNAYYSSIDDSFNDVNPVLGNTDGADEINLTDELFDSVLDKLPKTIYNFTLEENGNYILNSVSIEE